MIFIAVAGPSGGSGHFEESKPRIRGIERQKEGRCPYCHDMVESGALFKCEGCKAKYHLDCWETLRGCATLGCKSSSVKHGPADQATKIKEGTDDDPGTHYFSGMLSSLWRSFRRKLGILEKCDLLLPLCALPTVVLLILPLTVGSYLLNSDRTQDINMGHIVLILSCFIGAPLIWFSLYTFCREILCEQEDLQNGDGQ